MVIKIFKRGSKRLASEISKEGTKAFKLAKKKSKEDIKGFREERLARKRAFRSARRKALISRTRGKGRASVSGGFKFGIADPGTLLLGPRPKKKRRDDFDIF